jgi:hypothetical protein
MEPCRQWLQLDFYKIKLEMLNKNYYQSTLCYGNAYLLDMIDRKIFRRNNLSYLRTIVHFNRFYK